MPSASRPAFPASTYTANCSRTTYNKMSDFDTTVKKGHGKTEHSFGSRLGRFHYAPRTAKHGAVGPANYKVADVFSPITMCGDRTARFTFGVSRMDMKRSFIE